MKVLFINKFLDKHTIYRVPLGLLYLSASLKKAGHEVFIADPLIDDVFEKIEQIKPNVVGYSIRTGFHRYYIELNKKLKKKFKFISVFGGPHATFFPEMISEEGVDYVARGECDKNIADLLRYDYKARFLRGRLEENLDNLPFPDRALLDDYKEIKQSRIHNFITSRGCPYSCSYCFNHQLRKMYLDQKYVRRRSVDNVIEEIKQVANSYNLERVHFEDDTFNMDKDWLREFAEKYPNIPFKCNVRANLFDEEVAHLLKVSNCMSVTFAIEAGNDRIRNEILKRNMSRKQIINCAKLLKKYNIKFITENILANPTSTLADDVETLDLNLTCRTDFPNVSLLQPYPKTDIFKIAVENDQFTGKVDNLESFFKSSSLDIPDKKERVALRKIFALVVAFPRLRKHLNFLLKRNSWLYSLAYSLWRPYCLMFKIMPHKLSIREYWWLVKRYLR